jgi:hypothetical protein
LNHETQAAGTWPGVFATGRESVADDAALEAVFESLGQACVHRLLAVPHPFGLAPRDRRAAERWLSRRAWVQRHHDLTIVLALVALGLAAGFVFLWLYPIL